VLVITRGTTKGKSFETASAQALGRMPIRGLNTAIEDWDCFAPLVRVRCKQLKAMQFLHWVTEVVQLDPADYVWYDSDRDSTCPWERNLHGYRKTKSGAARKSAKTGLPELIWNSASSQLYQRHAIPVDADLVHISDARVLSRARARGAVRREIDVQVREAA
jgi:hypothetical protein